MLMNVFKRRIDIIQNRAIRLAIITAGCVSLIAYVLMESFYTKKLLPYSQQMIQAAQTMNRAIVTIRHYQDSTGIPIDGTIDPNRTGLIGPEYSELTTTLGNLAAKRTTTNPNFAALVVHLFHQAGVREGDTVAVGSSGSFPALMIASIAAAQAMHVHPVSIISLGASSFGDTKIDFNLFQLYNFLYKNGIFITLPAAVSLGGDKDIGSGFAADLKKKFIAQIQENHIPFIYKPNLEANIAARMKIYFGNPGNERRISAFVNTGGSYANLGASSLVLKLEPGITRMDHVMPPKNKRGVIFAMMSCKIPIIHLLYIRGLVLQYGLPWDPVPLPEPGNTDLIYEMRKDKTSFWIISILYFTALIMIVFVTWRWSQTGNNEKSL